jgi:hypothetical protein
MTLLMREVGSKKADQLKFDKTVLEGLEKAGFSSNRLKCQREHQHFQVTQTGLSA